jgi:hypothetical protein
MAGMATTFWDLAGEHVLDFAGVLPGSEAERYARRAVDAAINTIPQMRRWQCYLSPLIVPTVGQQTTGTVAFVYTGGTYERQLTLTGATWPTWVSLGVVRIAGVDYEVEDRKSSTVITLTEGTNPGADIASGTSYILYRDAYPLPTDFLSLGTLMNQTVGDSMPLNFSYPDAWATCRRARFGPSIPTDYTVMGSRNYLNTMSLFLWPAPASAYNFYGIYQRGMRQTAVQEYSTGTITVGASSTTVAGSGTAWNSKHVGTIIRFASSGTTVPTSSNGEFPYEVERVVTAVNSAMELVIDAVTGTAYAGMRYRISDPVDVRTNYMQTLLLRECEKQFRTVKRVPATREERDDYRIAQQLAFENDSMNFSVQQVTANFDWPAFYKVPLSWYP